MKIKLCLICLFSACNATVNAAGIAFACPEPGSVKQGSDSLYHAENSYNNIIIKWGGISGANSPQKIAKFKGAKLDCSGTSLCQIECIYSFENEDTKPLWIRPNNYNVRPYRAEINPPFPGWKDNRCWADNPKDCPFVVSWKGFSKSNL